MSSEQLPSFAADFAAAQQADWLRLVDKVLKGSDFEKRLASRTLDGLRIAPLYTRADELPFAGAGRPGTPPYARGGTLRRPGTPWDIRQRFSDPEPARANKAILADLEGGVTSAVLDIAAPDQAGLAPSDIAAALAGVMLDLCPVVLDAGAASTAGAAALDAVWSAQGIAPEARRGCYGADPIGGLARFGASPEPIDEAVRAAAIRAAGAPPHVTGFVADGRIYHAAGASEAQELAAVLATLVAYWRAIEGVGARAADAVAKIRVTLAADADQFLTIAKFRAARRLVWRLADAAGAGDRAGAVALTAETATRMYARRDPFVNILRATLATAAAGLGGADAVTTLPFTAALGRPDAFARRIARNIQIVLQEESSLGRVADPAGGSWYVEQLTEDLAEKAWAMFQEIERQGGIVRALITGALQRQIGETRSAREKLLASRRLELTGVSAFPQIDEAGLDVEPAPAAPPLAVGTMAEPLRPVSLAAPFEALRDRADRARAAGQSPGVFLVNLGETADHNARANFMANLLAAGGIAAVASEPLTSSQAAGHAFAGQSAKIACLCSSDAVYGELADAAASALKAAGASHVYLAGRPGEQESALRAAGVDGFIFVGLDVIALLTELHDRLGSPA